jgi:hypothetical protein
MTKGKPDQLSLKTTWSPIRPGYHSQQEANKPASPFLTQALGRGRGILKNTMKN